MHSGMSYRNEVRELGLQLGIGEQQSGLHCPFCNASEKSLSLLREVDTISYNCHRASCPYGKGAIRLSLQLEDVVSKTIKKQKDDRIDKLDFGTIPDKWISHLKGKYHLIDEEIEDSGFLWIKNMNRLWMPIYKIAGGTSGGVARSFEKDVRTKAYTILTSADHPIGSFYRGFRETTKLTIVEDILSAVRASTYTNTLALLGTHLSEGLVALLKSFGYTDITLSLDKDAFSTALNHQKKYGALFDQFTCSKLERDYKDTPRKELEYLLNSSS